MRESLRKFQIKGLMCEKKKKKPDEVLYIYLTFSDDLILSLFYAFSNEVGFVAKNKTNGHHFPFNDDLFSSLKKNKTNGHHFPFNNDLFSSLNVTFSDEMGFVTNSMTSSTF